MRLPRQTTRLRIVISAAWLTCAWSSLAAGQTPESRTPAQPVARQAFLAAARDIMTTARYCALITIDDHGRPQSRTIDAFPPGPDMVVWLATNPKSRKVEQLRRNPRVTLYYFDPADPGYVNYVGRARIVDDPAEKARRWKEGWEAFWPDRDRSYLLIEVTPERVEALSAKRSIPNDPVTWTPQGVDFSSVEPQRR